MKIKKKHCDGCLENRVIWKRHEGHLYCVNCWSRIKPVKAKPTTQKKIPSRSLKRSKEEKIYLGKRIIFLSKYPMCQAHIPGVCTNVSCTVHHKAGRIGDLLCDERYWLACCMSCHNFIERNVTWSKEMGFSLNRI